MRYSVRRKILLFFIKFMNRSWKQPHENIKINWVLSICFFLGLFVSGKTYSMRDNMFWRYFPLVSFIGKNVNTIRKALQFCLHDIIFNKNIYCCWIRPFAVFTILLRFKRSRSSKSLLIEWIKSFAARVYNKLFPYQTLSVPWRRGLALIYF